MLHSNLFFKSNIYIRVCQYCISQAIYHLLLRFSRADKVGDQWQFRQYFFSGYPGSTNKIHVWHIRVIYTYARKEFFFVTYFPFRILHKNFLLYPVISRIDTSMYSNDIGMYIRVYNIRLPCCPMPHHRASKLVFRLSIAHYLLSVTKITSLTFSLSPGRSWWRLRVHARARAHAYRAFSWHACIWGPIVSTIPSTLLITRSRTGPTHMILFSTSRKYQVGSYRPKSSRGYWDWTQS